MASEPLKNRDYAITDGENETTVIATCPHCDEPFTLKGKIHESLTQSDNRDLEFKSYCRGANGLSWNIRCCKILNCAKKNKVECNLNPSERGKIYPVNKQWNSIVMEEPNGPST